jgi:lysozyme
VPGWPADDRLGARHSAHERITPPISREQGLDLLTEDLAPIEIFLAGIVPQLSQGQFDACASLAFNIGLGAFERSTLLRMIRAGEMDGAAEQFLRWDKSGGKVLPGLIARRRREREMFVDGY